MNAPLAAVATSQLYVSRSILIQCTQHSTSDPGATKCLCEPGNTAADGSCTACPVGKHKTTINKTTRFRHLHCGKCEGGELECEDYGSDDGYEAAAASGAEALQRFRYFLSSHDSDTCSPHVYAQGSARPR